MEWDLKARKASELGSLPLPVTFGQLEKLEGLEKYGEGYYLK